MYNSYRRTQQRLMGFDYRSSGYYYIKISTKNNFNYFGEITEYQKENFLIYKLKPTLIGIIAKLFWLELPEHFPFILLDKFILMPNFIRAIIYIKQTEENKYLKMKFPDNKNWMSVISPKHGSLSSVVRSFKSAVSKTCSENNLKFEWEDRFQDHIIRTEKELTKIRQFIKKNPNWKNCCS